MNILQKLPEHYREFEKLDLENDNKNALFIHGTSIVIAVLMAVIMHLIYPITSLFEKDHGAFGLILRIVVMLALFAAHVVLHELTHGVAMKLLGAKKVSFGYSGMYAYAGCTEFFTKRAYIIMALTPVVFWGIVLTLICYLVPDSWFWIFYLMQIANIAGAAGDFFVIFRFWKLPESSLIHDMGTSMTIYTPHEDA